MKFIKYTSLGLGLLIALGAGFYVYLGTQMPVLDAQERAKLAAGNHAHQFIELSEGVVHYRLEGEKTAPTVVLVHGFSTPSLVWDAYFEPLTNAGFQVLAFDNYGRGLSDRPDGPYTADRTDRLLTDLLRKLSLAQPVHLVGYSMGGPITSTFAARHPGQVASLTLIAPAGIPSPPSALEKTLGTPVVGEAVMRFIGLDTLRTVSAQTALPGPDPKSFTQQFDRQSRYSGYGRALLSTARNYPVRDTRAQYEIIGKTDLPVLTLWGEADETCDPATAADLKALLPQMQLVTWPNQVHAITYAAPHLIQEALLPFLEAQKPALETMKPTPETMKSDDQASSTPERLWPSGAGGKPKGKIARMEKHPCKCHADDQTEAPSAAQSPL